MPQILKNMGFTSTKAQLMTAPPYACGAISALLSSLLADKFTWRMPFIVSSQLLLIIAFSILFALAADINKISSADSAIGDRKSAVVGVSYNLKKFTGRVAVAADRSNGRIAALSQPDNVSLDVGAAYNLNRRIALTGGVRYRVDQDRVATLADQRRDSQAVYVGTAFKF